MACLSMVRSLDTAYREWMHRLIPSSLAIALAGCASLAPTSPMPHATTTFATALTAPGHAGSAPAHDIYAPLLGAWSVAVTDHFDDGSVRHGTGEWHFSRVLEGGAVQDVWISPPIAMRGLARTGSLDRYGSTIRTPMPDGEHWSIKWLNPVLGTDVQLIGHRVGNTIVHEGTQADGSRLRWTFTDISATRFHWIGEVSVDRGQTWRLQQDMRGERAAPAPDAPDHGAMIESLEASSPNAALGDAAATFGWLLGRWELDCDIVTRDGTRTRSQGDWSFGWIVDGRMMQDALWFYPPGKPELRGGGTSLRLYDAEHKEWNVVWFSPGLNGYFALRGNKVGDRIVLSGRDTSDGSLMRWTFDDIKPSSFHWLGEQSEDDGKTWWTEQEMWVRRHQ